MNKPQRPYSDEAFVVMCNALEKLKNKDQEFYMSDVRDILLAIDEQGFKVTRK